MEQQRNAIMFTLQAGLKDLVLLCQVEPDTKQDGMLTAGKRWENGT